jgi:hypothetical protein
MGWERERGKGRGRETKSIKHVSAWYSISLFNFWMLRLGFLEKKFYREWNM